MAESVTHTYAEMNPDELDQFDRDFADISKMYSSQETDNLIQLWTGTEILASMIQPAILKMQGPNPSLSDGEMEALQTDKGQALMHLGFYKQTQNNAPYLGRQLDAKGLGMDIIRPEDIYGANSTFFLWDQPTVGWTAIPAALFQIRSWCELGNPDASTLAAAPEITTIDPNDDHWALLIFGVMELGTSVDIYAFHSKTNGQPRVPVVMENQIRVGDITYARMSPVYLERTTNYALGLEFRGDLADVPTPIPKPWGLCYFTQKRALQGATQATGRNRCRAA